MDLGVQELSVGSVYVWMDGGDPGSEDWTLKLLSSTLKHLLSLAALTLFFSFTQFRENNTPLPPLRPSLRVPPPLSAQSPG